MGPVLARTKALLALSCAGLLVGCGGATPGRDPVQEARVISDANAFCGHVSSLQPVSRRSEEQIAAIQARYAALSKAIARTAAYLPAGRDLNEAHAARRALFAEAHKRSAAGLARPADFNTRFDHLQLRIYGDELALGLKCAGLARAAEETARALARSASSGADARVIAPAGSTPPAR
jgi:hypothetical protein